MARMLPFARIRFLPALLLSLSLLPALSSPASAQSVAVSTGLSSGSFGGALPPVLTLGLTFRNVSLLGSFGLSARLMGDLGPRGGAEVAGLIDWPLDDFSERLTLYGGPGVALDFLRPLRVRPSLTAGLDYDLDGQLSLYGEGSYQIDGPFRIRAGVTYLF